MNKFQLIGDRPIKDVSDWVKDEKNLFLNWRIVTEDQDGNFVTIIAFAGPMSFILGTYLCNELNKGSIIEMMEE